MNATRIIIAAALGAAFAAPALASTVAAGFDSTSLGRTDDGFSGAVSLGFDANFFGNTFSTVYVSNNGYLTFGRGQGSYSPQGLGAGYSGNPIIAPFYDDVDTRNAGSGITGYGTGTYLGHAAFGATWAGVGYYSNKADKLDTFQVILADRSDLGVGDFDIYFNYGDMQWDSSDDTDSAAVGFNAGNGAANSFYQADGSLVHGAFVNGGSNALSGTQMAFTSRSGARVQQIAAPATPAGSGGSAASAADAVTAAINVPEPETFALLGLGVATALVARRRKWLFNAPGSTSMMMGAAMA